MNLVTRAYEAQVDSVMPGERSVVARLNTAVVDEYRTVILPMGGDLKDFNANPPVLWQHGKEARGSLPIGRGWVKARSTENDLIGKCMFAKDDFSQQLFEMYQDGTLKGWSINMIPQDAGAPTQAEIRANPSWANCETVYRRWRLKEFSAVAVPGNPEALTMLVSRGMWTPPDGFEVRTTADSTNGGPGGGFTVKPGSGEGPKEEWSDSGDLEIGGGKPESPRRYIDQDGDTWVVHAEDGKVLGRHPDEASARKQLAAVEAHKHDGKGRRSIIEYGGYWRVVEPDGSIVHPPFPDAATAEQCLRLLESPPKDYTTIAMEVMGPLAARNEQFARDVEEYIALKRNWKVF